MSEIKITPLGGLGETGALNCMLYESNASAFVVDCGVAFVDERSPGASLLLPNFDVLLKLGDKLKALLLTHGHEDHVGALPYLLKRLKLPVYATAFTRGIVRTKLAGFNLKGIKVMDINFDRPFTIGDFSLDPVFVNHSIMDVAAFLIAHNGLKLFHCTDFKIDHSAPEGRATDLKKFKSMGEQGLDYLLLDSTNALAPGWTRSELRVRTNLIEVFTKLKARVIACLFSSNAYRVQSLLECAKITGRKVAITGRGTKEYTAIARELDRLDLNGVELYDVEEITKFPDEEILVIVTGSQAEPRSVLARISMDMFRFFKIKHGDVVLMSAKMIPGNEGKILRMLDRLASLGAEIVQADDGFPIHASGHAKQDELRETIRLTRPRYFIPIHGSYRHLSKHIEIAIGEGVPAGNCFLVRDRESYSLSKNGASHLHDGALGVNFVSENPDFFISPQAISRRKKMALNGLVTVSVIYDPIESKIKLPMKLFSEGLFGGEVEAKALTGLEDFLQARVKKDAYLEPGRLQKFFKIEVRHFYKTYYKIIPEVIVLVHDV